LYNIYISLIFRHIGCEQEAWPEPQEKTTLIYNSDETFLQTE